MAQAVFAVPLNGGLGTQMVAQACSQVTLQAVAGNTGSVYIGDLGTGWDLKLIDGGVETFLVEKAQTNGSIATQINEINSSSDYAFVAKFDVGSVIPEGIRLGRGTQDRLVSVVNDNLGGLSDFTVRALGYKHYP